MFFDIGLVAQRFEKGSCLEMFGNLHEYGARAGAASAGLDRLDQRFAGAATARLRDNSDAKQPDDIALAVEERRADITRVVFDDECAGGLSSQEAFDVAKGRFDRRERSIIAALLEHVMDRQGIAVLSSTHSHGGML